MPWYKLMLGVAIVVSIYVGAFFTIISPILFSINLYHTHAIAAVLFLVSWTFYFLFIGYIFSAYKLLDMRWTTTWVRNLLDGKK